MIRQPIFIMGVGRSGSTVFHQVFCQHPNTAWLSRLAEFAPEVPQYGRFLLQAVDFPLLGRLVARAIEPSEAYPFWDFHYGGFSKPCRDLVAEDVTEPVRIGLPQVLSRMLTGKRNRLLVKITGWSRMGFLSAIFPDAKFIHVLRDGRAVANSLVKVDWWYGWGGPGNWNWGELTPSQRQEWERHNRSFIALAGIQWKLLMDSIEEAKQKVGPSQYLELRYEDLCAEPERHFRRAAEFCELQYGAAFQQSVMRRRLHSENDKWTKDLTAAQQHTLLEVLENHLRKYAYL